MSFVTRQSTGPAVAAGNAAAVPTNTLGTSAGCCALAQTANAASAR
ncbi:hypothetical protein [Mycobacterium sp.]|nr:hypothetical protein [Mycobacterium sp.]HTQ22734.1 hypothetical protein [Mycobacterium sp.]